MTQSNADFELDYMVIEDDFNKEIAANVEQDVNAIRKLLVFDDETGDTVRLKDGGFTHNIIGLTLGGIAKKTNNQIAQSVLDGFDLQSQGW
jgi:hypothetical protein